VEIAAAAAIRRAGLSMQRIRADIEFARKELKYGVSRDGRLTQWIPVAGPHGPAARTQALNESREWI
jgi:hypothetical protein